MTEGKIAMKTNSLQQLHSFGQSVWYDNISRDILKNAKLAELIAHWGVRGVTSNPSIFDNALRSSTLYDEAIAPLKKQGRSAAEIFEELALEDIAEAADLFWPLYQESEGNDGFVSIEVSPLLAHDAAATVAEAKRLFHRLSRPNIMIKVPGTAEGLTAIETLLVDGVNINVTLLFSVPNYIQVAECYCRALKRRLAAGESVNKIRSVASFFVSRVDTIVDKELERLASSGAQGLLQLSGRIGVANSRLAYQEFKRIFGPEFQRLREQGAQVQRPLWASTSTKNPAYRDVIYIEELIGRDTVNTMPQGTLEAFAEHGIVAETIEKDIAAAKMLVQQLSDAGVDLPRLLEELQQDGVKKFADSFRSLLNTVAEKVAIS